MSAGVYIARSEYELEQFVISLDKQGYRIVSVIDTRNDSYLIIAQQDITTSKDINEEHQIPQ